MQLLRALVSASVCTTAWAQSMSIMTDDGCDKLPADKCCPSGCTPAATELESLRYTGGAGCDGGTSLCTCDWASAVGGSQQTVFFTASEMVTDSSTAGILKGTNADPAKCRDACAADETCDFATFRWQAGQCYLWALPQEYHAPGSTCPRRKWWVGSADGEGGVNFVKGVPNPPSPPPEPRPPPSPNPSPPPGPSPPPMWPPHAPLVSAPEQTWPTEWFGEFACHGRHAPSAKFFDGCELASDGSNPLGFEHATPQEWDGADGEIAGYDWSLPPQVKPAPHGLYTLQRSFDALPTPPYKWNSAFGSPTRDLGSGGPGAAGLPTLAFPANPVFCMWVQWKQFETSEGVYDFSAIYANLDEAVRSGWLVGIRFLTTRVNEAATYLQGQGIKTKYGGSNYDPGDEKFHTRYLALLEALKDTRLCQNESVVMMCVGRASDTVHTRTCLTHSAHTHMPHTQCTDRVCAAICVRCVRAVCALCVRAAGMWVTPPHPTATSTSAPAPRTTLPMKWAAELPSALTTQRPIRT